MNDPFIAAVLGVSPEHEPVRAADGNLSLDGGARQTAWPERRDYSLAEIFAAAELREPGLWKPL